MTIGGKTLQDHLDVAAHDRAVKTLLSTSYHPKLQPDLLKELHRMAIPPPLQVVVI